MPEFSERSLARLATCHPDLQRVMREAIKRIDFTVLCGHRGREEQEAAVAAGTSAVHWPHGKHNSIPSLAVDIAPWPVDWNDVARFEAMGRIVFEVASGLGVGLRWGHDWDGDGKLGERGETDCPHFELHPVP